MSPSGGTSWEASHGRSEAIERPLGYLKPGLDQIDDPTYRQRDMAKRLGAVESVGKRLAVQPAKRPGMHWIADSLEVVPDLRSIFLRRAWEALRETDPPRAPHDRLRGQEISVSRGISTSSSVWALARGTVTDPLLDDALEVRRA